MYGKSIIVHLKKNRFYWSSGPIFLPELGAGQDAKALKILGDCETIAREINDFTKLNDKAPSKNGLQRRISPKLNFASRESFFQCLKTMEALGIIRVELSHNRHLLLLKDSWEMNLEDLRRNPEKIFDAWNACATPTEERVPRDRDVAHKVKEALRKFKSYGYLTVSLNELATDVGKTPDEIKSAAYANAREVGLGIGSESRRY